MYRNTYVEVNIDNIKNNVKNIINYYDKYKYYFGVVKGNAYGHGSFVVNAMIESGINYLAVASLEEGLDIRKWNSKIPILCLQPIALEFIGICIEKNIAITVHDYDYFKKLLKLKSKERLTFHLKFDTGMNRLGINDKKEVKKIYDLSKNDKRLYLEGIFTHMATSGINDKNWDNQLSSFEKLTSLIELDKIPIIHIDRSITMMCHEKKDFCNGVRLGIAMYGYNQLPNKGQGLRGKLRELKKMMNRKIHSISKVNDTCQVALKPAFSLYSEIIQIKKVKKGEFIGYGTGYKAREDITVATIPIGYADGMDLRNSGRDVVINKKRYPIIGSVNMGMISVKIDDTIKLDNKVTIIGEGISAREISRYLNTTVYELITTIGTSVPRKYIENNKIVHIEEYR